MKILHFIKQTIEETVKMLIMGIGVSCMAIILIAVTFLVPCTAIFPAAFAFANLEEGWWILFLLAAVVAMYVMVAAVSDLDNVKNPFAALWDIWKNVFPKSMIASIFFAVIGMCATILVADMQTAITAATYMAVFSQIFTVYWLHSEAKKY